MFKSRLDNAELLYLDSILMSCMKQALFLIMLVLLFPLGSAFATTFDVSADWSDSSNPNGPWSYNDGLGSIPNHFDSWLGTGHPAWSVADSGPGHIVAWGKLLSSPPFGLDWIEGDVWTHSWDSASGLPGRAPSELIWTSPANGMITISGHVWMPRDIDRSVDWIILKNNVPLTSGSLFSGDPYSRASPFELSSGSGGLAAITDIPITVGDVITLRLETISSLGDFVGISYVIDLTEDLGNAPVGGEIIPVDMTSLFVAGAMTNAFWILPTLGGIAGAVIGLFKVRRKHE